MTQVAYQDPRVGKFSLPTDADRDIARAVLSTCVVLSEAKTDCGQGWEFIAASPLFEALREGEEIPRYRIEFAAGLPFEDAAHDARRIDVGPIGLVAIRQYVLRVPPVTSRVSAVSH